MLSRTGRIRSISSNTVQVEFDRTMGCGPCQRGQGCGSLFASIAGKTPQSALVDVTIPGSGVARVGDLVTVSLTGRQLVIMACMAYLLPLVGMIGGAWAVPILYTGSPDLSAAAGMMLGLGAAFLAMFLLRRRCFGLTVRAW